jgi:hypothetical protein
MRLKRYLCRTKYRGLPTKRRADALLSPLCLSSSGFVLSPRSSLQSVANAGASLTAEGCSGGAQRIAARAAAEFDCSAYAAVIGWSGLAQTDRVLRCDLTSNIFPRIN